MDDSLILKLLSCGVVAALVSSICYIIIEKIGNKHNANNKLYEVLTQHYDMINGLSNVELAKVVKREYKKIQFVFDSETKEMLDNYFIEMEPVYTALGLEIDLELLDGIPEKIDEMSEKYRSIVSNYMRKLLYDKKDF